MPTEHSPLLGDQHKAHADSFQIVPSTEGICDRFSDERKRVILTIVSLIGVIPMLVDGSIVPSIPQISKDLRSSPAVVSLAISVSVFASALSVMLWSACSSCYGRRATYICGMFFTIIGAFTFAASTDLYNLLFWRFVLSFGCAGGCALGTATIGDIYGMRERGSAMGTFFGVTLVGLAIAPTLGGASAQYWSWRGFHAALGLLGVILLLLLIFLFPETAHSDTHDIDNAPRSGKPFVCVNPFRCITFLRSPNIMAVALANTFALLSDYTLLVPIAYTIGAKYGITSGGLIGLLFLPNGFGNFVGALVSGHISDQIVRRAREERKGAWVPEDRLRVAWIGGLGLIPASVTLAGLTVAYVDGTVGLVISLLCLFCNGLGVYMVLAPVGTYTVDVMPSRSVEVMGAIMALRSLLIAPISAMCIPSVETIGVAATNSVSAILALIGYALIWLTIRYGRQMRAYVNVGFPDC